MRNPGREQWIERQFYCMENKDQCNTDEVKCIYTSFFLVCWEVMNIQIKYLSLLVSFIWPVFVSRACIFSVLLSTYPYLSPMDAFSFFHCSLGTKFRYHLVDMNLQKWRFKTVWYMNFASYHYNWYEKWNSVMLLENLSVLCACA